MKPWLEQKGFFVAWSTNCALCPVAESLQHVFMHCTNAELFWAEIRVAFDTTLYPNWVDLKFLEPGSGGYDECIEVITLLGLYAIWRSRNDHLLAVEGGKPAWNHFVDAFFYTSSVLQEKQREGFSHWPTLHSMLMKYVTTNGKIETHSSLHGIA